MNNEPSEHLSREELLAKVNDLCGIIRRQKNQIGDLEKKLAALSPSLVTSVVDPTTPYDPRYDPLGIGGWSNNNVYRGPRD